MVYKLSAYKPVPVSKLLSVMQNMASLILDLAYSTLIFKNDVDQLKTEVLRLEIKIDKIITQLEIQIMLATRDVDDAKANISFLRIGQALNKISDAAADIATLSTSVGVGIQKLFQSVIENSDERIAKITILEKISKSFMEKTIAEIEDFFGIDIMAISKNNKIYFNFNEIKIEFGDEIFVRGPSAAIKTFEKVANGTLVDESKVLKQLNAPITPITEKMNLSEFSQVEREIVLSLIKLKHKSELSINLAFSSLLLNDKRLANEVIRLEKELDHLDRTLGLQALRLESKEIDDREKIFNLIRLSKAMEEISDASLWIIEPFIINTERHPLLSSIVQETEEKVSIYEVEDDSEAINKTVSEFETKVHGIWIVAVYRPEMGYIFDPSSNFKIKNGDTLLLRAYGKQMKRIEIFEETS